MDHLASDLMMNVLSFVNVVDACQGLQFTSKRFYYLVHHYQELAAPEMAAGLTEESCLAQLSRKPTMILTFHGLEHPDTPPRMYPPDAVVLGAIASDVQANIQARVTTEPSVIMASFPPETTHVTPFHTRWGMIPSEGEEYHLFIVYVCHDGYSIATGFIASLQARYPNATIVGGVCRRGFLSLEDGIITEVGSGIFGIMAHNITCKSIVSLGVQTLLDIPYHVHESQLIESTDDNTSSFRRITSIRDHEDTVMSPGPLLLQHQTALFGLRRQGGDEFKLIEVFRFISHNTIIFPVGGSRQDQESFENAELNLFRLDVETCEQHLNRTLQQLKKQTRDESMLGAVMFGSIHRGPRVGEEAAFEEMTDATQFQKHFPTIPCCGFYGRGQIGPLASPGHETVFQMGKAAMQNYTVVFAVFIVPTVERRSYNLDDSDENVIAFANARLGRGGPPLFE